MSYAICALCGVLVGVGVFWFAIQASQEFRYKAITFTPPKDEPEKEDEEIEPQKTVPWTTEME